MTPVHVTSVRIPVLLGYGNICHHITLTPSCIRWSECDEYWILYFSNNHNSTFDIMAPLTVQDRHTLL